MTTLIGVLTAVATALALFALLVVDSDILRKQPAREDTHPHEPDPGIPRDRVRR